MDTTAMEHNYTQDELDVLADCGMRQKTKGAFSTFDGGYRPDTPESIKAARDVGVLEDFTSDTKVQPIAGDFVHLLAGTQSWTKDGKLPKGYWQREGVCVGGGYQNAGTVRILQEIMSLAQGERFNYPFVWPAYGRSRNLIGLNDRGDGSSGATMAVAGAEVGIAEFDNSAFPQPQMYDTCFSYGSELELKFGQWSSWPENIRALCKPFVMKFQEIKDLDQAEQALRERKPLTVAGNWGGRTMNCPVRTDDDGVKILWNGERVTNWEHQQSCIAVKYAKFSGVRTRLWLIWNQWYMKLGSGAVVSVHGTPQGSLDPHSSYWVGDAMMLSQLRYKYGVIRALADFSGYTKGLLGVGAV